MPVMVFYSVNYRLFNKTLIRQIFITSEIYSEIYFRNITSKISTVIVFREFMEFENGYFDQFTIINARYVFF